MTNRDWMFCPSDATDRSDPRSQVSYWWKCAVDKAWYGEACSKAFRKLNDFYYYADDVLLYEHRGWHFGDERGLKNGIQINAVFLDTHVKTAGLVNSTTHYTQNPTAYGEPMYFNCDMKKPCSRWNPPAESLPARYVDPGRYSDILR